MPEPPMNERTQEQSNAERARGIAQNYPCGIGGLLREHLTDDILAALDEKDREAAEWKRKAEAFDWRERKLKGRLWEWIKYLPISDVFVGCNAHVVGGFPTLLEAHEDAIRKEEHERAR